MLTNDLWQTTAGHSLMRANTREPQTSGSFHLFGVTHCNVKKTFKLWHVLGLKCIMHVKHFLLVFCWHLIPIKHLHIGCELCLQGHVDINMPLCPSSALSVCTVAIDWLNIEDLEAPSSSDCRGLRLFLWLLQGLGRPSGSVCCPWLQYWIRSYMNKPYCTTNNDQRQYTK